MKKNLMSLFLAGFFIVSIVLSASYIIVEANHDCNGRECPICFQIQTKINTIKEILGIHFSAVFLFALALSFLISNQIVPSLNRSKTTLVSLKIIMNF
ncbi:MAG: hypothetical protein LBV16_02010 [Elusimicrobiota bacterium]|jgi:hypothetical protein|nr:hypothetical protein [Elusimicrobiota bacterium]